MLGLMTFLTVCALFAMPFVIVLIGWLLLKARGF
jgi:hypothetical protein